MKKKNLDRPEKITTTLEELEVLTRLKGSVEWAIVKRVAGRYVQNLRKISFGLIQSDPKFILRHTEMTGQALGIRTLIKLVEKAEEKLEKEK